MTDAIGSIGSIMLALVLVGSAVVAHRRAGRPVLRYALIWAAILAIGFALALLVDQGRG